MRLNQQASVLTTSLNLKTSSPSNDARVSQIISQKPTHNSDLIPSPKYSLEVPQQKKTAMIERSVQTDYKKQNNNESQGLKFSKEELYNYLTTLSKEEKQEIVRMLNCLNQTSSQEDKIIQVSQENLSFENSSHRTHQSPTFRSEAQNTSNFKSSYENPRELQPFTLIPSQFQTRIHTFSPFQGTLGETNQVISFYLQN